MIAELGNYALALALALSVFLAVLPFSIEPLVRCAILLVRR